MHHLLPMNQERGEQLKPGDVNIEMLPGGEMVAKQTEAAWAAARGDVTGRSGRVCPLACLSSFLYFMTINLGCGVEGGGVNGEFPSTQSAAVLALGTGVGHRRGASPSAAVGNKCQRAWLFGFFFCIAYM